MKKLAVILGMCMMFNNTSKALKVERDTTSEKSDHLAIGYNINDFGNDFGVGINLTSPYFVHKIMAVRVSENYQEINHLDNLGKYTWTGYHNIRVGVLSTRFILNDAVRLYGEGGIVVLVNPPSLTATKVSGGVYGLFGFEFFITKGFSYFIELGGIGTGATAEKAPASPIYSNGFMTSVGLRIYL